MKALSKTLRVLLIDRTNSESFMDIPYLFTRAGVVVDAYCGKPSWLLKSRFVSRWFSIDTLSDIDFIKTLTSLVESGQYCRIIVCDDDTLSLLNEAITDEVLFKKIMPLVDSRARKMLGSKAGFSNLCEQNGINTPAFCILDINTNTSLEITDGLRFPVVIKLNHSAGGTGVFFCKDQASLKERLNSIPKSSAGDIVLQEYIVGDNIAVEALYSHGILLEYAVSKVLSTIYGEFGMSISRVYEDRNDILSILIKAGQVFGADGFANMTLIYEPVSGRYYLLEMDMRPNIWFRLCRFAGIDFTDAIRHYVRGSISEPKERTREQKPVYLWQFSRSITWAFHTSDFREMIRWVFNIKGRWKSVPVYDSRLFIASILRGGGFFKRLIRRRHLLVFRGR